ncbi:tetratricopeptide repeat protein [Edaphobacter bradus]|uniref:tetratricopeptide repeat protein n=1 Tax=Edaphobacter bradus TaxID=2259016 RepID=UPI0021E0F334|nr:tetratricopeptide repeat protein [Edaphobacter bradus]
MKAIWFYLLWMAVALPAAFADTCSGAESQIKTISRDLARNAVTAAESLLAPLQGAYPDCAQLLLARARIKAAQGSAAEAQDLFLRYLEQVPDDSTGMAYFARFLIDQAEYQRADDLSAGALDRSPSDPAALAVRGQILDMKRQSQLGLELLKRSCELDPDDADAQFQLGALYDRAKRPAEAVKHFQKAVDLDPGYAPAWDYLALNLEPLGEMDRADAAYKKGLAVNQDGPQFDAFLDYNYGRFLAKRNQLVESKRHLDRAVELVPDFRATWYDRAKLNLRLGNYPEARTDAEKAASLTAQIGGIIDLQIYALLEQIYRRLGETELAEKYAVLTRETPPPVRKGYEQAPPQ